MGNTSSKRYSLPLGKNYNISYCRQYNHRSKIKDFIDLSSFLIDQGDQGDLISKLIIYEINKHGYSLKPIEQRFYNLPLNQIIKNFKIKSSDNVILKDVSLKSRCYFVNEENIKSLLSDGNILIAGIIIDQEFSDSVLDRTPINYLLTDIVLIIGYSDKLVLKTNWCKENVYIDFNFLCNIKEIWNIIPIVPEDKFLEQGNIL
jgi:hypothetical protein